VTADRNGGAVDRQEMRAMTTATRRNSLSDSERDRFLALKLDGRLGTNRGDGWWHVTPCWYLWEGGMFFHSLGVSRRHLRNLRQDPHATLCVDIDNELNEGLQAGTRAVVCFGVARITSLAEDESFVREITERLATRYLGEEASQYEEMLWVEERAIAIVTPSRWLTWDLTKR
jgi:nitroimidazol reductase NimA-like FMN-containing flavoprotein (pyridoxamine 5'-phosphate oxidase superfamily)